MFLAVDILGCAKKFWIEVRVYENGVCRMTALQIAQDIREQQQETTFGPAQKAQKWHQSGMRYCLLFESDSSMLIVLTSIELPRKSLVFETVPKHHLPGKRKNLALIARVNSKPTRRTNGQMASSHHKTKIDLKTLRKEYFGR